MTPRGSAFSWLASLVRNLFRGGRRDAELRSDIDTYVDMLVDEKIAAGLAPDAARRSTLMEFGSVDHIKDDARSVRAGALVAELGSDARYALRMMRRDWTFSAVAIVTLALGIGANTAIFSIVNGVLLKPLPYAQADRLVLVWERNLAIGKERDPVAPLNYQDWRSQNTVFEELGAFRFRGFALDDAGDPEQLQALEMSSSVFRGPGVSAGADACSPRRKSDAGIGSSCWHTSCGSGDLVEVLRCRPKPLAQRRRLYGYWRHARELSFPDGDAVDLYSPLVFTADELNGRRSHSPQCDWTVEARRHAGHCNRDMRAIAQRIFPADRTSNPDVTIAAAHDVIVEDARRGLIVLFAAVGIRVAHRVRERCQPLARARLGAAPRNGDAGRTRRRARSPGAPVADRERAARHHRRRRRNRGRVVAAPVLARIHPPDLPRVDHIAIDRRSCCLSRWPRC